jgi:hypothetical protein
MKILFIFLLTSWCSLFRTTKNSSNISDLVGKVKTETNTQQNKLGGQYKMNSSTMILTPAFTPSLIVTNTHGCRITLMICNHQDVSFEVAGTQEIYSKSVINNHIEKERLLSEF